MKKRLAIGMMAICATTLLAVNGCKKSASDSSPDYTSGFTVQTADQTQVSTEDDAVSNDVNLITEADSTFAGRTENVICDATVTRSTTATTRVLTITYTGANCSGNRTRTGVVILTLPKERKWGDAGAKMSVTYQNLTITRVSDHKSIVLNGTKTITNVSGGKLINLATLHTIIHTITSDSLSITFDDGTKRVWHIAKQRTFTYDNGLVISTRGIYSDGTVSNISEWGTNRAGKDFMVQIREPIVIRQDCDFRIVSGKIIYSKLEMPVTVTFGLNASGVATGCPGTGHYYYKIEWTNAQNVTHILILPY